MTIIVSVNPKVFAKAVSAAKSFGGTFNGATKTWKLDEARVNAARQGQEGTPLAEWLGYRGLKLITGAASVKTVRHDDTCPALLGLACECDAMLEK